MKRAIREVDWETYEEVFPDRYLEPSAFDSKVGEIVDHLYVRYGTSNFVRSVLDIGGGKSGTRYLDQTQFSGGNFLSCWLLDPFVDAPDWMEGSVDWNTDKQFDLIVCRGSFNYLQRQQIMKIPSMLKSGGVFIFNTFYEPKNGSRRYKNSRSGTEGMEMFRRVGNHIIHRLEPDDEDYVIQHKIKIRPVEEIVKFLGTEGLSFEFLGTNTLFVRLERNGW